MSSRRLRSGTDVSRRRFWSGWIEATEQPRSQLCTACFSGRYPIELPPADRLGKHLLEQNELPLGAPEDGLLTIVPSTGGATALEHP